MRVGRRARLLSLGSGAVALALFAAACGERQEPTGSTVATAYPVTVQGANEKPLEIASAPRHVLPVSTSAAAIVDALGKRSLVPGAPASGQLRPFPVRSITATPSDLIIGSQTNDALELERAASAAKTPLLVIGDSSLRDLERSILDVGLAIGAPVEARALVRTIDDRLAAVKAKLAGKAPVKVFVDTGFGIPIADDTFAGELLRAAGATNVAGNADAAPFPHKLLLAAEPDFYIATETSGATLDDLRHTPGLRNLAAVREGRFAIIPATLLRPGTDVGDAVLQLYGILHPDTTAAGAVTTPAATTEATITAPTTTSTS